VGGVSERPARGVVRGRNPASEDLMLAAVEGIPVCGMTVSFAGRRRNVDLGSVRLAENGTPPLSAARTGDSGCPEGAEEGNVRPHALFEVHAPIARSRKRLSHASVVDASFAWSSDPCTSIATATSSGKPGGGSALESVSRSGKPG
jgi:hypothetical protein